MSVEEGWQRGFAIVPLSPPEASALIGRRVSKISLLSGGLRNTNYRIELAAGPAVLRIYAADRAACQRECDVLDLVGEHVPVPRVLDAQPAADPPWAVHEFIDGQRFDRINPADIGPAAFDAGQVLARMHAIPISSAAQPDLYRYSGGGYGFVEFVGNALRGRAGQRLGQPLSERLMAIAHKHAPRLQTLDTTLQHSDYKPWNLLVHVQQIVAVLDWEFAFAGWRLNDLANFLRYCERQPPEYKTRFVDGYLTGGGQLPEDWFRLARLIDLMGFCDFLSRPADDPAIRRDITPLVERTIDLFST
ncbi:MAG TPA: aminoglycoside phosphotransferase family protein [Chloroflexota bacterium]